MALAACPACGHRFSSGAFFCPECGRSLRREEHAPRRREPHSNRRGRSAIIALGVTPDGEPIRPRPAAQVARRPLSFPSPMGAAMIIGGSFVVLVGAIALALPADPLSVFGTGGRALVLGIALVMLALGAIGRYSPSGLLRFLLLLGAAGVTSVAIIDTRRLAGAPRGAGMGVAIVGAILVVGGTFLREER